jgi:hypothetical protein
MIELKTVPITLMFVVGIYVAVSILWTDHVSIPEFVNLKNQLIGVQFTLSHDHLDTRLHSVESELFTLNQHVLDEQKKSRDVDVLYYQRIDELKNQHEDLVREIRFLKSP